MMENCARYRKGPMPSFSSIITQMWPPKPHFTEQNVPDQYGKVYFVTGGSSGVGREVVRILYSKNATVYIAARSEPKATQTITTIHQESPHSKGQLHFLPLDLSDLTTLKPAIERFTQAQKTLHCLINNAATQTSAPNPTAQGFEIHFGVNVLAPFLLTNLLLPTLQTTSQTDPDVRVIWLSSLATDLLGESTHGISRDYLTYYPTLTPLQRYGVSKAAAWLHGAELAKRFPNITSIICNPGHVKSDLYRDQNWLVRKVLSGAVLYPVVFGAYTVLLAATSPEVTRRDSGRWMVPWGRWGEVRRDLRDAVAEEGNGHARGFWDWCVEQVGAFM